MKNQTQADAKRSARRSPGQQNPSAEQRGATPLSPVVVPSTPLWDWKRHPANERVGDWPINNTWSPCATASEDLRPAEACGVLALVFMEHQTGWEGVQRELLRAGAAFHAARVGWALAAAKEILKRRVLARHYKDEEGSRFNLPLPGLLGAASFDWRGLALELAGVLNEQKWNAQITLSKGLSAWAVAELAEAVELAEYITALEGTHTEIDELQDGTRPVITAAYKWRIGALATALS